jgi:hypothetical protein
MNNNGCFVVLLSSIKVLRDNLEQVKDSIDDRVYEKTNAELSAMKRFVESMM